MRLEKLEVYGFKSFADKTEFHFEPGLTAFVGPNGCGKSNVVDAVRWVLGEQRPKALRGSEMADVIFKGNADTRRSLGFAEVTITLDNRGRTLPIEYDQVAITRRLYRSGESEYLINKQPCRLRDIRELLMDTGIGMDAYSIVEQGKIDLVLQSNPKDRRSIFEEAAGISKYNAKRRAAARKLERVEQNLLRLGDTIEEVKKRLRSIRRQAAAARRYKEHAENLRRLRLAQQLHTYHRLVGERAATDAAIAAAQDDQQALQAAAQRIEAQLAQLDTDTIEAQRQLARLESQHAEFQAHSEALEESIRLNRERIRDAEAARNRIHEAQRQLAARLEHARSSLHASRERLGHLEAELQDIDAEAAQARADLQELTGQCGDLGRRSEALRTEVLDALRQRAAHQNQLASLHSECRALEAQRQRLARRDAEIAQRLDQQRAERTQVGERIEGLEAAIEADRARFAARAEERGELRAQIESLNEQVAEHSNTLSAKNSRRDLLEDLEARFEGVELGTQTLLERQADGQCLHGMVADLLQVEPQYALAIEAALGGAVQHLVADTLDSAAEAVTHLKAVDGGRTTLLPLDRLLGSNGNGHELLEHPGVISRALDLVHFDPHVSPAIEHLLGDTYVVEDLEAALQVASATEQNVRLATLAGDVLQPRGTLYGGSPHEHTGLLSRKNELRTLADDIRALEESLAQLRSRRDHFINESAVLDSELEEARQRLNQLNLDLATAREQASRIDDRIQTLEEERLVGQSETEELHDELDRRRQRVAELAEQIQACDRRDEELKARLAAIDEQRRQAQERRDELERHVGDLAVQRAQKASEREHLAASLDRVQSDIADFQQAHQHAQSELAELAARRQAAADEIAAKEGEIQKLRERKDALGHQRVEAENRRAQLLEDTQSLRQQLHDTREQLRLKDQETQDLRLQRNEHELRINDLAEKVQEEHRQDLRQLHEDYQEPDVDWEEVAEEMAALRRKLDNMGTVNLLAIEEQAELEQRADFLASQEQDLLKAKHSLQEVIRKVNRQSRQLFEQTFQTVRQNFQNLFRKLFGGGKADILLEPDVDVLEAGVEIIAKPPGKELSRLSLLSGGEKSLTAAALLLAIFKSKPSPFCILDEVDAALDDSNIGRFVGLLREFLRESQFIIITHSKQTMGVADVLYGITMQEPGVSTKVAVRLDDVAEPQVA
ncbi:MAG: chromosome segregation protein SMC [bacterium]